ncbi:MAG: FkbM family methyltransferase [Kiloniellales bacterium]
MVAQFSLVDLLPEIPEVNLVDIGAMLVDSGPGPYASLLRAGKARVTGFEPNSEECEKLHRTYGETHRFYPFFIGDGEDATFHETNMAMTGSLYRPNAALLEKFQNLHELMTLKQTHAVKTHKLDDIDDLGDVDLLKIDTQGAELDVLRGATKALAGATLVQVEVEFLDLYEGQPLFADIDTFLRGAGFRFHTFLRFSLRCFKPLLVGNDPNFGIRQLMWSDAIYVRDFLKLQALAEDKLLKLALMLHDLFQSFDFCHYVLSEVDRRNGSSLADNYLGRLKE